MVGFYFCGWLRGLGIGWLMCLIWDRFMPADALFVCLPPHLDFAVLIGFTRRLYLVANLAN